MELPFIVEFGPPRRLGVRRLVRTRWVRGLGAAALVAFATAVLVLQRPQPDPTPVATLVVTSHPSGAAIEVDGHAVGKTPADLELSAGEPRVTLRLPGYLDATYSLHLTENRSTTLAAELWLRTPRVTRVRPTYPGAQIAGTAFLADGRVALTIAIPSGDERQLWLIDGDGGTSRVETPGARGGVAISSDGNQVAFLAAGRTSAFATARTDEIWVAEPDGAPASRRYALPSARSNEQLVDLGWAPDGKHLLVVTREQAPAGTARARFLWIPASTGDPTELLSLPSDLVLGSYTWSPDGEWVAFLARSGQTTSLCVLAPNRGHFRYVADLGREATPPPFTPVAWSAEGRQLLYAAPGQDRPFGAGWLFGGKNVVSLFVADPDRPPGRRLGQAEALAPVWPSEGGVLALAPAKGSSITLREIGADGVSRDLGDLPIPNASSLSARWDAAHAQAIVATRASGSLAGPQTDYWLVRFRPERSP